MKIAKRKWNDIETVDQTEVKRKRDIEYVQLIHRVDVTYFSYFLPVEEVILRVYDIIKPFQWSNGLTESEALLTLLPESLNYTYEMKGVPSLIRELYIKLDDILFQGNLWYPYKQVPTHSFRLVRSIIIHHEDCSSDSEEEDENLEDEDDE